MFITQSNRSFKLKALALRSLLLAFLLGFTINKDHLCSNYRTRPSAFLLRLSTQNIPLDGNLTFENVESAAKDFGNRYHLPPSALLHPKSVSDISNIIKHVFDMGLTSDLTVAARGHGHSLEGQSQAYKGIVINMESLASPATFFAGENPYIDVSAGELWINILHESLEHGLAPKSWTDYLHLTVGGTLSNAGVSGQAFRHGPQINNVYQLEVVTGRGEVVTCSEKENEDLFHAVLGGLGQFGVITRARIALEKAPTKVKWIRALYSDFTTFTNDQEHLISSQNSFDYIEGFVIINRSGLLNKWRSSFNPIDPIQANRFVSDGRVLFCLEVAKYFSAQHSDHIDQEVDRLLSRLNYIRSTLFVSEVSYTDFLDRVHVSEMKLREQGLWEVPHPWLNLIVPRSSIHEFAREVFNNIVKDTTNGPILIYPVNKSRWINRTSLVMPDEDVVYLVAFLTSAIPSSTGEDGLESILTRNTIILDFTERSKLGIKQYLPHYTTTQEWKAHFGVHWEVFSRRKMTYDPLAILAPGQGIFGRAYALGGQ